MQRQQSALIDCTIKKQFTGLAQCFTDRHIFKSAPSVITLQGTLDRNPQVLAAVAKACCSSCPDEEHFAVRARLMPANIQQALQTQIALVDEQLLDGHVHNQECYLVHVVCCSVG